jgi:hypothetical protein
VLPPSRIGIRFALLALALAPRPRAQEEQAEKPIVHATVPAPEPPAPLPLAPHGSVDLRWVGRWTDGSQDNDLHAYGSFTFGDPEHDVVTLSTSGRVAWDFDGEKDPTDPFFTVEDTRDSDVTGYLYTAYADLNGGPRNSPLPRGIRRVRAGRQTFTETPVALFIDGASVASAPIEGYADLVLEGWAGVPVHFYESSRSHDFAAGAAASFVPWTDGRLRADYMHIDDEYLSVNNDDDLLGFRLTQRMWSHLDIDGYLNVLDGDARDAGVSATWSQPEDDLTLTARYLTLWNDQNRQSIELDYFTPLLQTFSAFDQFELSGGKGLGEVAHVDAGVQWRELRDEGDQGVFNHEFRRYWASPGVRQWPWSGLDASVTFELWDAGGDRFTTVGADFTQELDERWRLSVGTAFQLYRYDALLGQEDEDVQVTYARLRWRATDAWTFQARFDFEDGETDDFIGVTLGARIDF